MEKTHDDFISEAVDILVDLLKGKDYEEVRRVNYLVNIAKQEDLKKSLNKLKSMTIKEWVLRKIGCNLRFSIGLTYKFTKTYNFIGPKKPIEI